MANFLVDDGGYTAVYANGFCIDNGRGHTCGGIGVWFYPDCSYNVSAPVFGKASNHSAEIDAVTSAANQALSAGISHLKIYTSSEFAINCFTQWLTIWRHNGWRTETGEPVNIKPELLLMEEALDQLQCYKFVHVKHQLETRGNVEAIRLARAACEINVFQEYNVL